jgi:3-deoxy-manno-octulosonate cytidylyltransferase (CMP-KDO synthetase)
MSEQVAETYVATCDEVIYEYITSVGGKAVMTGNHHLRCSDRTAEAVNIVEKETGEKFDIVLMVQGDEPMIVPKMVDLALHPLFEDESINITNLMAPINSDEEHEDPNEVKVVVDQFSNALYFSREPIPSKKKGGIDIPRYKQVCVIPFRRDYLNHYQSLKPTPLEIIESVDMNRVLEHGEKIRMVYCDIPTYAVDTDGDLAVVVEHMKDDPLIAKYS